MQKPLSTEYNPAYQKYFDLVPDDNYEELLRQNSDATARFFEGLPSDKHDYRYAEGKWTIKEVFMHIIDTERVFAYRALAAARGDESPVYRMDEELYARNVDVSKRTIADLVSEFKVVRRGSEYVFENLNDEQSTRSCNIVTHPMSVRAIGYFLIGHVQHHIGVVRERYCTPTAT
ncbi:MAG TPA: DinB family protein [Pyrinomonadaceae bacterium]|jgi:uncharacterized damage-inducible protein DinB|nr:DinB family protein [Pyrinomonadaceae bacterium]